MAKSFVLHDESVNTYGFRMLTSGANLTEFKKNPVMLLNHTDDLPIGRWENIRVENGKILADPVFSMKDERAARIAQMVKDNFIRMASIGAWPPEEVSDEEGLRMEGQTGITVTKWTVRESSIVTIGGNHNALAMYDRDGKQIDLNDKTQLIRLFDGSGQIINNKKKDMKILAGILNLSDSATENEVAGAVRGVISERDRLKTENDSLKTKVEGFEQKEKDKKRNEAVALVDGAVKDARIHADLKDKYLSMFDKDFDTAKQILESIPKPGTVSDKIKEGTPSANVKLRDMTFSDILKKDLLKELKKDNELYREKFFEAYGKYPE